MSEEDPLLEYFEDADQAEVDAIFEDVEQVMADLAGLDVDVDDPEDLDRVRQKLPTEPHRAELVHAALPPALRNAIEYVHPSDRQSGYWRRSRDRTSISELSDAELRHRKQFVESAIGTRDLTGVTPTGDGRQIPRNAAEVGDALRGESFVIDEDGVDADRENGRKLLGRIRDWF